MTVQRYAGGLNAATTCLIVDVIQSNKLALNGASQTKIVTYSRVITCCFGALSIVFAIIAKYIGQELALITSVAQALCNAPTFGMFLLGMATQHTGSKDAAIGYCVRGTCTHRPAWPGGLGNHECPTYQRACLVFQQCSHCARCLTLSAPNRKLVQSLYVVYAHLSYPF